MQSEDRLNSSPKGKRPRFSLFALMLVMVVVSVAASCGYYLFKAWQKGESSSAFFVVSILAAPLLLLTLVSILHRLLAVAEKHSRWKR